MNHIRNLRWIGIAEGISFLVLLGIAMPLKYWAGLPQAVKVVGWAHGLLFVLYIAAVFMAARPMKWGIVRIGLALAASLVPAGPFLLDKDLARKLKETSAAKVV